MKHILPEFSLVETAEAERFGAGLIHETYLVRAGKEKFILQKMNPIFPARILKDVDAVSRFMKQKGRTVQELIRAKNGALFLKQGGSVWRLFTYIPGRVYLRAEDPEMAYEAGKILGRFHRDLSEMKHVFAPGRSGCTPEARYEKYLAVVKGKHSPEIEALKREIARMPEYFLPEPRLRVAHGDPKISNIVWTERGVPRAKALIDIDECTNRGNTVLELGDALRSWCGNAEDDSKNVFDMKKYREVLRGYEEGSGGLLSDEERGLLLRAAKLKCLELASRFLVDYFEDNYFGWDEKRYRSRKEHNLARAKGQVALARSLSS